MSFSPQRILKSKYLAYRYFEAMNKDNIIMHKNATPILAFDSIIKDAIEKVNSLTGKSYTHPPSFPEHKEMFDGNVNMTINGMIEMCKAPSTAILNNFMMFTLKNNKQTPHVFVFNKQEMCMYTLAFLNKMMRKRMNVVNRVMEILSKSKLEKVVGMTSKDIQDECVFAESQLPYVGKNRNAVIFQALCNCNKINILIEYLVTHERVSLFNYFPYMYNKMSIVYKPIVCTNEGKHYYIMPYTQDDKEFDINYY